MSRWSIFVSYSRRNRDTVEALISDLQRLGHSVWYDGKLTGSRAWWPDILENIRRSDVFIFTLSPETLNSDPCSRELSYALALRRHVLPLRIAKINTSLLPKAIRKLQILDYQPSSRPQIITLSRTLNELEPPGPLPNPLPQEPEAPLLDVIGLNERVNSESLSLDAQKLLVYDLERLMHDEETTEDAIVLLSILLKRGDLFAAIEKAIKELLEEAKTPRKNMPVLGDWKYTSPTICLSVKCSGTTTWTKVYEDKSSQYHVFDGHKDAIFSVRFAPTGTHFITGSIDGTARIWNLEEGLVQVLNGHVASVNGVGFSPDGSTVITASSDHSAQLWDARTGRGLRRFTHRTCVDDAAFSPDGQCIATASGKAIRIWNTESGKELFRLDGHQKQVNRLAYSPNGQTLLSWASDDGVKLWDIETRNVLHSFSENGGAIGYSPDGNNIFTSGRFVWQRDVSTGKKRQEYRNPGSGRISALAVTPDRQILIAGSDDKTIRFWNITSAVMLCEFTFNSRIYSLDVSPDGKYLLVGAGSHLVRLWELALSIANI